MNNHMITVTIFFYWESFCHIIIYSTQHCSVSFKVMDPTWYSRPTLQVVLKTFLRNRVLVPGLPADLGIITSFNNQLEMKADLQYKCLQSMSVPEKQGRRNTLRTYALIKHSSVTVDPYFLHICPAVKGIIVSCEA